MTETPLNRRQVREWIAFRLLAANENRPLILTRFGRLQ